MGPARKFICDGFHIILTVINSNKHFIEVHDIKGGTI